MKVSRGAWIALLVLTSVLPAYSQEKQSTTPDEAQTVVSQPLLKVQFLVTEYDGTKKIASLPYTTSGIASRPGKRDSIGILRVGARIPASTQKAGDENITYIDVGTNIDYWVWLRPDSRYQVSGTIELSSLFGQDSQNKQSAKPELTSSLSPILNQTRADFTIGLADGQPGEALSVTDPITGRVFKLEVTADALK
jgi:hypothetical protein